MGICFHTVLAPYTLPVPPLTLIMHVLRVAVGHCARGDDDGEADHRQHQEEFIHTQRTYTSFLCRSPDMQQTTRHHTSERGRIREHLCLKHPGLTLESLFCRCSSLPPPPPDKDRPSDNTSAMHPCESMLTVASMQRQSAWLRRSSGQHHSDGAATRARARDRPRPWRKYPPNQSQLRSP